METLQVTWEGAICMPAYAAAEEYSCLATATYLPGLLPKSLEGLQLVQFSLHLSLECWLCHHSLPFTVRRAQPASVAPDRCEDLLKFHSVAVESKKQTTTKPQNPKQTNVVVPKYIRMAGWEKWGMKQQAERQGQGD